MSSISDNKPGYIYQKIGPAAPEKPDDFSAIVKDIKTTVMEGVRIKDYGGITECSSIPWVTMVSDRG